MAENESDWLRKRYESRPALRRPRCTPAAYAQEST